MTEAHKCALCGRRVGDRFCPALNAYICSTCCGLHRKKSIACPPSCPYLVEAEKRRQARRAQELAKAWERLNDALIQKRQAYLIPYLELLNKLLAELAREMPLRDKEAIEALEYLARRLAPIEVVEVFDPPLGRLLWETMSSPISKGELDPDILREACRTLAEFAAGFSDEKEQDRYVAALLGTYPEAGPEENAPQLIVRP